MSEGIEVLSDYSVTALPTSEDNMERVVRYSLIGRPDFEHGYSQRRMWAPWSLMIRFARRTTYRGGMVVERTEWRLTNVELYARLRLKAGGTSDSVDLLVEFEDLPHDYMPRPIRAKEPGYPKIVASDFPYVGEMIDACRPSPHELV